MQKIRKAVIPAAGLGTRVLPATKAMPKEMLPIVDKPAIQYIVEEAVAAGIEEILIITGRGKGIMEDHFDRAPELEAKLALRNPARKRCWQDVRRHRRTWPTSAICARRRPKGLGHAILQSAHLSLGDEPFVVLYGDDVIMGEDPVAAASSCRAYEAVRQRPAWALRRSRPPHIVKYSSMKLEPSCGQPVQHHRHDREARARTGIQPVLHPGPLPADTGDLRHPREDRSPARAARSSLPTPWPCWPAPAA